jgi:hypothetical protein
MKIYYLMMDGESDILHGVTFTTEKLAIEYGNGFDDCEPYKPFYGWKDKTTGKTLVRLHVASLRVD